jgi:DNA-directed RNA polymerase specialized sigma24 family protein
VPKSQNHERNLPRGARQFPFRIIDESERAEIDRAIGEALLGIEDMLYKLARELLPRGADEHDVEEAVQHARVRLWQYSLPRFDATRGVKVSTFLHTAGANAIRDYARQLARRWSNAGSTSLADVDEPVAPDRHDDAAVEELADALRLNPEAYLPAYEARVFRDTPREQAKTLKIASHTVSCYRHLVRQAVADFAAEHFAAA